MESFYCITAQLENRDPGDAVPGHLDFARFLLYILPVQAPAHCSK